MALKLPPQAEEQKKRVDDLQKKANTMPICAAKISPFNVGQSPGGMDEQHRGRLTGCGGGQNQVDHSSQTAPGGEAVRQYQFEECVWGTRLMLGMYLQVFKHGKGHRLEHRQHQLWRTSHFGLQVDSAMVNCLTFGKERSIKLHRKESES
ncbi:hypothetical protein ARMGADRAFT_1036756 [Armillaria gallica]|uniref:Uncharacterized protein n=1 Tax=Armillaria gallica TaxID=47427 RepID=A0A2H3CP06_ARMGA|nr:hypothetical protein ARMGADRAFT_1036756 [Armillaria gallica]